MFIADFHIHSKYSRATSRECVPEMLDLWARRKGIAVVGTGDFTHPGWRRELKEKLVPAGDGLYTLKEDLRIKEQIAGVDFKPRFLISGEISSIYKKKGKVRKIHNLILLPGLEEAEAIAGRLEALGNLRSDGRPILGLDSRDLLEIVLKACPEAIFIPAHIWTPHFSLYGAYSGFDEINECFEDLTGCIFALETGLSSDPPMNWRLSGLDNFVLLSNSDAHSPANLGREANIFHTELSYFAILRALKNRRSNEFYGTIEFFPEEGKYHYDGHRSCKVCLKPEETKTLQGRCPVCGGKITVGVLHRVEELADREEGFTPQGAKNFESLMPLPEVIASASGSSAGAKKVKEKYAALLQNLGTELFILREAPLEDIASAAGELIAEGIRRLRCKKVIKQPGYDGEYGKITLFDKSELKMLSGQMALGGFTGEPLYKRAGSAPLGHPAGKRAAKITGSPTQEAFTPPSEELFALNEKQQEAAFSSSRAIVVIAGPGTGKTKTLIARIAYLVEKCAVSPSCITAVTFTNKAAQEIRLRLAARFGKESAAQQITVGTFHSICLDLLTRIDGQNINLIDEYNALAIVQELLKKLKIKISPKEACRKISLLKNSASALREKEGGSAFRGELLTLYELYCSMLKEIGAMDYDDLILEALNKFKGRENEAAEENSKDDPFSYLLVDEFQDINEAQYQLIKRWGQKAKSIFIIGDPHQSIYGFRGSDYRYFDIFMEDFPSFQLIRLNLNYRSTPEIIKCAEGLLLEKEGSSFALQATKKSGPKVRLVKTGGDFSEALYIAKEINRMVGGIDLLDTHRLAAADKKDEGKTRRAFSEIAVLYRTNRQAERLEECLLKEGIPFTVGGKEDFLAEQPVREAISFFRFLLNPKDFPALLVCLWAKGLLSAEGQLKDPTVFWAEKRKFGEITKEGSISKIIEKLQQLLPEEGLSRDFLHLLKKYAALIRGKKPGELIASWIKDNELAGIKSMELLLNTSVMYEDMASFLQNLLFGREGDVLRSGHKKYLTEAVSLMTIHSAKGLEFPAVFICGLNEGIIPLKSGGDGAEIDLQEERRLFYVAITRAKEELILLSSGPPSPFIPELPEEEIKVETEAPPRQRNKYRQVSLLDI